ncbi:MAG: hypothetical protein IJ748_07735 [Bacteroidales bacterium]|nr:hypothetical protein [Bacteroidales bacterium]
MNARKIIYVLCFLLFFVSCKREDKGPRKFYDNANTEKIITFKRFDRALFSKPVKTLEEHLIALQKDYPDMFQMPLTDKEYMDIVMSMVLDKDMQKVQNIVEKEFPNLDFLSKDLTSAFARLKDIYPQTSLPENVYTLILGGADYDYGYTNRVYMNDTSYYAIALDVYALNKLAEHPYYKQYPKYMRLSLGKEFIAPDFMRMYLLNHTFASLPLYSLSGEGSLLDCIIEDGKFSYLVGKLLPNYSLNTILRYDKEQMLWVEKNEEHIWAFIIQNKLLYDTDRSKYLSLIAEGPETKGLSNSPARVGNYIGYKIVDAFMKENDISVDSLMKIKDNASILQHSNYKPKKK